MQNKAIQSSDQKQIDMVQAIKSKLENTFDKVQMSWIGIGNKTTEGRAITIKVYEDNKYECKELTVKYIQTESAQEYVSMILYGLKDKKYYTKNIASLEERYIIDLVESYKCENFYIFDNELHCEKSNNYIGLDDIEEIHYNKIQCIMTVLMNDDEKLEIDFLNETIELLDSKGEDKLEPITEEYMERICKAWNKQNYWCDLILKDGVLQGYDKENKHLFQVCAIDGIERVEFKSSQVYIGFTEEDKYGFDCCFINKYGIEY